MIDAKVEKSDGSVTIPTARLPRLVAAVEVLQAEKVISYLLMESTSSFGMIAYNPSP